MMKPNNILVTLGAVLALSAFTHPLHAEEGGAGQYIPGSFSSALDITPTEPGFGIATDVIGYSGSLGGGRALPLGGVARAGLDAEIIMWDVALAYTFKTKVLGASYTMGAAFPFLWEDVSAEVSVTGPRGRTITRRITDDAAGYTDTIFIPAALTWTLGNWKLNFQEVVFIPTGEYEVGRLANLGKNIWSFDSVFGASYMNPKSGTEFTIFSGFLFSTENNDTDYQNGNVIHTEATLAQYLPLGKNTLLAVGVNGFYFQQVTGDSGSGATLGDLKGRTAGLGPVLNLIQTIGEHKLAIQAKWLPELGTKNRLEGDWLWLTLGMSF